MSQPFRFTLFPGDDINSNTQQGTHARRLRSLTELAGGPTVLVGCHPVKNAAPDNLLPIGGGAFLNEVDGNMTAAATEGGTELHWQGKFRGPDFPPSYFSLPQVTHPDLIDSRGRPIFSVMASPLTDAAKDEIATAMRESDNRLLQVIAEDGEALYSVLAVRLGFSNKMAVKPGVDRLQKAKLATIDRGRPVVTDKGEKLLREAVTAHAH